LEESQERIQFLVVQPANLQLVRNQPRKKNVLEVAVQRMPEKVVVVNKKLDGQ
jgi:hypothetical protein